MLESGETRHIAAANGPLRNFPLCAPLECVANAPRPNPGPVNIPVVTARLESCGGVCVGLLSKLAKQGNKGQDWIVWETRIDLKCGWTLSRYPFNFSASQWGPDVLTSLTCFEQQIPI